MFLFDDPSPENNEFANSVVDIILLKNKILSKKNNLTMFKVNKNVNIIFSTGYIGYLDNCYKYASNYKLLNLPVYIDSNKVVSFYNSFTGLYNYREGLFLNLFSENWDLKVFLELDIIEDLKIFIDHKLFFSRFKIIKRYKCPDNFTLFVCKYKDTMVSFELSDYYNNEEKEVFFIYNRKYDIINGVKIYSLEFIE